MKIATFNVNGINGRLQQLLSWLEEAKPDVVCLQELKSTSFPIKDINDAGYGAIWIAERAYNGVAILSRGETPLEVGRVLPGDPTDKQARYIEAAIDGILIACLYLPNGNPQPGPRFDYKLDWFRRLNLHAKSLLKQHLPVVLAGDFNVVPTNADMYATMSWDNDALTQPESRSAFASLLKQGWTDSIRARHPDETIYTYWDYKRQRWPRNAGLRIDHLLLSPLVAQRLVKADVDVVVRGMAGASDHAPVWIELAGNGKAAARKKR